MKIQERESGDEVDETGDGGREEERERERREIREGWREKGGRDGWREKGGDRKREEGTESGTKMIPL